MIVEYRGVKIYCKFVNRKKDVTNIFLHGWGVDHKTLEMFDEVMKEENSLFVDFPPFGKSGKELVGWSIFTYANMVINLCEKFNIEKYNLIGHSFGGRVAILVAAVCKEKTHKLVLLDSAGVKPKRKLMYYVKVFSYKIRKKLGLDVAKYGSADYKKLDDNMKKIFTNIVNSHLEEFMSIIRCRTLVVFGKEDTETPIYMGKEIHKRIVGSKLVVIEGAGHFCFVDRPLEVCAQLKKFIEES